VSGVQVSKGGQEAMLEYAARQFCKGKVVLIITNKKDTEVVMEALEKSDNPRAKEMLPDLRKLHSLVFPNPNS
jgi:hypothetical protein